MTGAQVKASAVSFRNANLTSHVPAFTSVRVSIWACRGILVLHDQKVPLCMRVMCREDGPSRSRVLVPAVRHPDEPLHVHVLFHVIRIDVNREDVAVGPHLV